MMKTFVSIPTLYTAGPIKFHVSKKEDLVYIMSIFLLLFLLYSFPPLFGRHGRKQRV